MKLVRIIIVLSLAFTIGCTHEQSGSLMSDDESEIRAIRKISNKAIKEHNTEALASTLTFDYHVVTSRNFETAGKKDNVDRYANEFNIKSDVIYIRTPESVAIFPEWKMASENGKWVGRWTGNGQLIELSGSYFAKWHKEDGQWLVRAEIFVPLQCTGGMYCQKGPL